MSVGGGDGRGAVQHRSEVKTRDGNFKEVRESWMMGGRGKKAWMEKPLLSVNFAKI